MTPHDDLRLAIETPAVDDLDVTLFRDVAAVAMAHSLVQREGTGIFASTSRDAAIAKRAFDLADAMVKERARRDEEPTK